MIFNIPEWPASSSVKHTETTWVLTDSGNNIIQEVDNSTEFLLAWELDSIIPTGEVYYVKALRYLEDSDGNSINNTNWIGPKPVFSEESSVSEYLAPKLYVETPYIEDIKYDQGDKLYITITPPETNVAYISTLLMLEDLENNTRVVKVLDIVNSEPKYTITLDSTEVDFNNLDKARITIAHNCSHSVTSTPINEIISLRASYFKVNGNTKDLDPIAINDLTIKSTTYVGVDIKVAELKSIDGVTTSNCIIVNDKITLPRSLDFEKNYNLHLTIGYTDDNGVKQTTDTIVGITTRRDDEITVINKDMVYDNTLTKVSEITDYTPLFKLDDANFNTEEMFTYSFPLLNKNSGKLSLFGLYRESNAIAEFKRDVLNFTNDFTFRLISKSKGLLQYVSDGKLYFKVVSYDSYRDTIVEDNSFSITDDTTSSVNSRIVQLVTGVFCVVTDNANGKVIISKIDMASGAYTNVFTFDVADISDVFVSAFSDNKILIATNGSTRFKIFNTITNTIDESINIPTEFRNVNLLMSNLLNGNILVMKYETTDSPLDYFIVDASNSTTTVYNVDNGNDTSRKVTNIIKEKSGNYTTLVNYDKNGTNVVEVWRFK